MTRDARAWGLALLAALALTACDKAVTSGNANAPGSPGTGNAREVVAPAAPDTARGGTAVMGATGSGGSYSPHSGTGTGTAGGLGGSSGLGMTGSFPASGASAPGSDASR